ncbi:MAG: pyridoxamine 5'-phosphate oxidase family protein [Eubacteriales bacterium]|nr:pyridoxamine 5'-phosphate oxidase family protein [Eubacteriales bacterium]
MRRADRRSENYAGILETCKILRLGLCENEQPYVVPMNFGYDFDGTALTLYLHCAREGKKLDVIAKNPNACFEMDCGFELKYDEASDTYTSYYECLMGFGKIEVVQAFDEKLAALKNIMVRQCGEGVYDFDEKTVNAVTILRLRCTEYTAKANKGKK